MINNFIETSHTKDNFIIDTYIINECDDRDIYCSGTINIDNDRNINIVKKGTVINFITNNALLYYKIITPLKTLPCCYSELIKNKITEVHRQYKIKIYTILNIVFE